MIELVLVFGIAVLFSFGVYKWSDRPIKPTYDPIVKPTKTDIVITRHRIKSRKK